MAFNIRQMTIRDYGAVIALWRGTPGMGLDDDNDSRLGIARFLKRPRPDLCLLQKKTKAVDSAGKTR